MKKRFATFLIGFFWIHSCVFGYNLELNLSYDYFRGMPDGSWNGNSGLLAAANFGVDLYEGINGQVGGSYGLYNWNGRANLQFKNPKQVEQQGFVTAGFFATIQQEYSAGLVYDRLFTRNFGIYGVDPNFDQLRFHLGYQICREEIGMWGTVRLQTAHRRALGLPVRFRAINQLNLFWTHFFDNCASTLLWAGVPYGESLEHRHGRPGNFIAGFALRAPLMERLFIDGYGSYMSPRHGHGLKETRNYAANVCIGVTYLFGEGICDCAESRLMPIANHANLLVDTNFNL